MKKKKIKKEMEMARPDLEQGQVPGIAVPRLLPAHQGLSAPGVTLVPGEPKG
jgi:hypothetical protein